MLVQLELSGMPLAHNVYLAPETSSTTLSPTPAHAQPTFHIIMESTVLPVQLELSGMMPQKAVFLAPLLSSMMPPQENVSVHPALHMS